MYTYNKYSLAQQTYAARKQEVEIATSDVERQRGAADLAQSQNDAESSKEDMKSAQQELAAVAGAQAARSIISKVSGIAPSIESLAQAEPQAAPKEEKAGGFGFNFGLGGLFGGGKKAESENAGLTASAARALVQPQEAPKADKKGKDKPGKADKDSKDNKKTAKPTKPAKNESKAEADKSEGDLAPAPARLEASSPKAESSGLSFELKNVNLTARKCVLAVAIKNNGSSDFSFTNDSFTVMENNQKLAEAAMRADFDTTLVQPNQEVKGTITIFGRPWNDKMTVSLSEGGKFLQMRR